MAVTCVRKLAAAGGHSAFLERIRRGGLGRARQRLDRTPQLMGAEVSFGGCTGSAEPVWLCTIFSTSAAEMGRENRNP